MIASKIGDELWSFLCALFKLLSSIIQFFVHFNNKNALNSLFLLLIIGIVYV